MEDVSYFTHADVSLRDIEALARAAGYTCFATVMFGEDRLTIEYGGQIQRYHLGKVFWDSDHWHLWNIDLYDWGEDEEREQVIEYNPTSLIAFLYHQVGLPELGKFLKTVLKTYGGLVWGDEKTYTLETIESLVADLSS